MLLGAAALAAELINHGTETGFRPAELDLSSVELSAHLGAVHAEVLLARMQRRARRAELVSPRGAELRLHRAHHLECLCHLLLALASLLRRLVRRLLGQRLCRPHLGCGRFLDRCHLGCGRFLDSCHLGCGRFLDSCHLGGGRFLERCHFGGRARLDCCQLRKGLGIDRSVRGHGVRLRRPTHLYVDLGGRGAALGAALGRELRLH
eukprot:jgi/Chrpa1/20712/Chrysochromulina_OHIO_Genome00008517-RA